jgi:hypothetical protein
MISVPYGQCSLWTVFLKCRGECSGGIPQPCPGGAGLRVILWSTHKRKILKERSKRKTKTPSLNPFPILWGRGREKIRVNFTGREAGEGK